MHRSQHKELEQRRYLRCSSSLCCHLQKFNSSLFSIKFPALATFWLRRQIAETPRFALAQGNEQDVTQAVDMASGKEGAKKAAPEANNVQSPRKDTVKQEQETQSSSTNQRNKVHWQELFTAYGIAASLGKVGAFIGAFIFPLVLASAAFKLPGAMGVAAGICAVGFLLTFLLPEPNQKSLETIEKEGEQLDEEHAAHV